MTTLLIDADMLLFRTMAAYEVELELEADMWVRWADLGVVREEFWGLIGPQELPEHTFPSGFSSGYLHSHIFKSDRPNLELG